MTNGVSGSLILVDKPLGDDSPLSRCCSDAARTSPVDDPIEDKKIVSNFSTSSKKISIGMPIKMLIAHEMSRELDSKHNSPSLVAKLMGLDALPTREPNSVLQKNHSEYSCEELEMRMPCELRCCLDQSEYKDVYEVFKQSQYGNYTRSKSPHKGKHNEDPSEKKMALVREKFIEAKRLSTDEKLRQSKRFRDALDVLSTNRDLFLKFLQEPNSLISQHRFDSSSVPPTETKRITVLKPSKLVESSELFGSQKNEKQTARASDKGQKVGWDKGNLGFSPPNWKSIHNPAQPTRIVVLKPSNGKLQDIKAVVSPPLSPRFLQSDNFLGEPEDDDAEQSRQMNRHRRDDTLLSSVFSNGYIGDESSFHKSESEYVLGDLSDSEVVSPTSRHSWDYVNRAGSPLSSSSFGRASCAPESSVCREAKKRLSERWAMVASNGSCVEQPKHVRRRSSTLGEMLVLSDPKSYVLSEEGTNEEQEARGSTSCLINDLNRDENVDNSHMNLLRSKSVPASTMVRDTLNLQVSNPEVGRKDTAKEMAKSRSLKASFKGKVSSFFSRSKRSSRGKANASQSDDDSVKSHENTNDSVFRGANRTIKEEGCFHTVQALPNKASLPDSNGVEVKHHAIFPEAGLSPKPMWLGNPRDSQDQPSPISVLEQLFEEDDYKTAVPRNLKLCSHGANLRNHSLRSNLIDKSPPIGSIARTLSQDNSCLDERADYALPPSSVPNRTWEGEQEWLFYVQSLLSAVGLGGEAQPDSYTTRWHSPDSPLDPSLRDRYIDLNEKEIAHEGKRRRIRSTRKLVFDCVNAVLRDMTEHEPDMSARHIPNDWAPERIFGSELADRVLARMREWFSVEVRRDDGDGNSLVVERVVREEVVAKGWTEHLRVEIDNIGKEIEGKLLEELVLEAVIELTGRL